MAGSDDGIEVAPAVLDYLHGHNTLTVATVSPAGVPYAATMVYVNDDLSIYFSSRPGSTTIANIEQNPAVAFTIDEYTEDWATTRGIQGSGDCRWVLDPTEVQRVVAAFEQKFPFLGATRPEALAFFRITPTQLSFIDNSALSTGPGGTPMLGMDYRKTLVFSVFRDLPREDAEQLSAGLDSMQVDSGQVIVRQGAPADKFFIIVDGEVEVLREDAGEETTVARLGAGQFFGEVAILRDVPRTATIRSVLPTTLLTMDRDQFKRLVAKSLATTEDLDQVIRERMEGLRPDAGR